MARKKRTTKRKTQRVTRRRTTRTRRTQSVSLNIKNRIMMVFNNLLLFIALSLVSFVLYRYVQNDFLTNFFLVISMVFGFVAVGFLVALVILLIMKSVSKKK